MNPDHSRMTTGQKPRLTLITTDLTKPETRKTKMTPTERETKLEEMRAILKTASVPKDVFPPDEGHSYFDASPAQIASRVSSLSVAAQLVMTGSSLCDQRLAESICVDLLDTAAWLSRQLAQFHDDLDSVTMKQQRAEAV